MFGENGTEELLVIFTIVVVALFWFRLRRDVVTRRPRYR